MKTRKILLCGVMAVLCFGLIGCSISLSGSAKMNAGGTGVIIEGAQPIVVQAAQPKLAEAPPPPPKPAKKAKIVGKKIVISEKVMFDYNKATIKVESNDLLNDVAAIIKEYASLKKIAIEGHTDADGRGSMPRTAPASANPACCGAGGDCSPSATGPPRIPLPLLPVRLTQLRHDLVRCVPLD